MNKLAITVVTTLVLLAASAASAQDDAHRRRRPPEQALEACAGAETEAACSFEGHKGRSLEGSCQEIADDLACVPDGHEHRGGKRKGHKARDCGDDREIEPGIDPSVLDR
jgi:hypothetical protein